MSQKHVLAIIGIVLSVVAVVCSAVYLFAVREEPLLITGLLCCCLTTSINAINNIKQK